MQPQTLADWLEYVDNLDPDALYEKARVANTLEFVSLLRDEGLSAKEITRLLKHFGTRLLQEGLELPGRVDAYLDYASLLEQEAWLNAVK